MPIEEELNRARTPVLKSTIISDGREKTTYAMADSGCEGTAFIDYDFAKEQGLPFLKLRRPFRLYGYDKEETNSYVVRYYTRCEFRARDHVERDAYFYITPLAHYPIILGIPWLRKHDPKTSWKDWTFTFDSDYCRQNCRVLCYPTRQRLIRDVPTLARTTPP